MIKTYRGGCGLEAKACFKAYDIDVNHKSGKHHGQIKVYGSEELRDIIVELLNGRFDSEPLANRYNATQAEED